MIFATVGTHEQQFNRLISYLDKAAENGSLAWPVFAQIGYSDVVPQSIQYSKFLTYEDIVAKMHESKVVITHGGPASIMLALQLGKVPVVVPRQSRFKEHVNDHQVDFVRRLDAVGRIIAVYEIEDLMAKIEIARASTCNLYDNSGVQELVGNLTRFSLKIGLEPISG